MGRRRTAALLNEKTIQGEEATGGEEWQAFQLD